jgi:hypothetical protein
LASAAGRVSSTPAGAVAPAEHVPNRDCQEQGEVAGGGWIRQVARGWCARVPPGWREIPAVAAHGGLAQPPAHLPLLSRLLVGDRLLLRLPHLRRGQHAGSATGHPGRPLGCCLRRGAPALPGGAVLLEECTVQKQRVQPQHRARLELAGRRRGAAPSATPASGHPRAAGHCETRASMHACGAVTPSFGCENLLGAICRRRGRAGGSVQPGWTSGAERGSWRQQHLGQRAAPLEVGERRSIGVQSTDPRAAWHPRAS